MTQLQIHYFLVVADEGSITRAANRLFVSQPAISKSVAALEKELGFPLFFRQDNSLTLTHAGAQLFEFFTRSRDEFQQLLKQIELRGEQTATQIRIGCPSNWNPEIFYPQIVELFSASHPNVTLSIECFPLPEMIGMLKNRQLDLVLMLNLRELGMPELESRQIASTQCGILYSKKRFPNVTSIHGLRDAQFLGCDSSVRELFESIVSDACGDEFIPTFKRCANYQTAVFELSRGNGAMVYIDWDIAVRSELFDFLPLDTHFPISAIYLAENTEVSAIADELAALFDKK